ncbi:MAG: YraN family protein [Planctomycetota bacterium]
MCFHLLDRFRRRPVSLGERGERAAARFLRRAGCQIIARHHRDRFGEIDLIASDGRAIIFVEVKTRRCVQYEHPAEAVNHQKQRRVTRTAMAYMKRHRLLNTAARFDIIAVTWPANVRRPTIEHFPGAFDAVER